MKAAALSPDRADRRLLIAAAIVGGIALLRILYPAPTGIYLIGLVFGALYGLIAAGLILIWRSNRIVNFAQGDLGAVPALLAVLLVIGSGWNFFVAAAVGILAAIALGAVIEIGVVRRFWGAPRLVLTVATIGLAQILAAAQLGLPRLWDVEIIPSVPTPFDAQVWIGGVPFSGNHFLTLAAVPVAMGTLAYFLHRTLFGTAVRATAERAERAQLLGIPVHRLGTIVWIAAAVLSAVGAWFRASLVGAPVGSVLGPALLLRALAPAAIARMESLPIAFAAALGVGVLEQVVFYQTGDTTRADLILFAAVLGALLLWRRPRTGRVEGDEEASTWRVAELVRPIPAELRKIREVRWARGAAIGVIGVLAVVYPLFAPPSRVNLMAVIVIFAIIATSLLVLTGWAGQISLGQMAFVGFGAAVTGSLLIGPGVHWLGALIAGAVVGAGVAVVIGIPALRVRGLLLAVTTLTFALASSSYFLNPRVFGWLVPDERIPRPGTGGLVDLTSQRSFYFFTLVVFVLVALSVARLRRTRMARALVAARDNEDAVRSYGVNVTRLRLQAFALSGFLAALAGGLFVFHQHAFSPSSFLPAQSLMAFSMVVIGGLGSMLGAVLGAVYVWSANFFLSGPWRLLGTGAGLLVLLLVLPGGLSQLVYGIRDRFLRAVAARHDLLVPSLVADRRVDVSEERVDRSISVPDGEALLRVRGLDVSYGGTQVLFGVDLDVPQGEIIALLGTNGAGKTTLLKAIAGLIEPDSGEVHFEDVDVTGAKPDRLVADGIVLVPGGRGVFPTLTVADNLRLAGWRYRRDPAHVEAATARALELFGVLRERWDTPAGNLSGGEQQMLTLAQALITRPKILLVDELSLGLAPIIVEELLDVVRSLRDAGTTVVLVEQSVTIALEVAHTAYFMEKGEVRFRGETRELLDRPDLLRSVFLGQRDGQKRKRRTPDGDTRPILEVSGLTKHFGGVVACDGVDLAVRPGQVVGIIGPNGAGKTTLFDLVSGFMPADAGVVVLDGEDVSERRPEQRAQAGLGRSFQHARLFAGLTVRECIAVAFERHLEAKDALLAFLGHPDILDAEERVRTRVDEVIELLGLGAFADKFVGELSTGSRRIVDIACVLAHRPSVLLLDEPSSGIAQREVEALGPLLDRVREETGAALVLVEHDVPLVTSLSDELVAMDLGRVIARGWPSDVVRDPEVLRAYLGSSGAVARPARERRPSGAGARAARR